MRRVPALRIEGAVGEDLEEASLVANGAAHHELDGNPAPIALVEWDHPGRRFQSDQPTRRRRNPDRAGAVGGVSGRHDPGGDSRRCATRRASRRQRQVMGISGDAGRDRFGGPVHHELGDGRAANGTGAGGGESFEHGAGRAGPDSGREATSHFLESAGFG